MNEDCLFLRPLDAGHFLASELIPWQSHAS